MVGRADARDSRRRASRGPIDAVSELARQSESLAAALRALKLPDKASPSRPPCAH